MRDRKAAIRDEVRAAQGELLEVLDNRHTHTAEFGAALA